MRAARHHQPEWPSDERGIVKMIDAEGRCCWYTIATIVFMNDAAYSTLRLLDVRENDDRRPILLCKYNLSRHGDAWLTPVYGQRYIIAASHYLLSQGWKNAAATCEVN